MQDRTSRSLPLFDNDFSEKSDEVMRLNKSFLLDVLHPLKTSDSMNAIRQSIADLKNQLHGLNNQRQKDTSDNNSIVEFTKDYLVGELDQIAESQTLERALY